MIGAGAREEAAIWQLHWNRSLLSEVVQTLWLRVRIGGPRLYADAFHRSKVRVNMMVDDPESVCPPSDAFAVWDALKDDCRASVCLVEGDFGHQIMLEAPATENKVIETAVRDVSESAGT